MKKRIDVTRRDALLGGLSAVVGASLFDPRKLTAESKQKTEVMATDERTQSFWRELGKSHQNVFDNQNQTEETLGVQPNQSTYADPQRMPIFFCAVDPRKSSTWCRANEVPDSRLLDTTKGKVKDVNLQLLVNGFKLSNSDHSRLGKIVNGSLRIDVGQTSPLTPTIGNLVWTALAAIVPGAGAKLPQTQAVNFDPGTVWGSVQKVPLPDGGGSILWNFFLNKEPSGLSRFLHWLRGNANSIDVALPLLGFPGYVLSAFEAFNKILGAIPQTPTFLFQQTQWSYIACTNSSAGNLLYKTIALRMFPGAQYVIVPEAHSESFFNAVSKGQYVLADGRVVKPGEEEYAEQAALTHLKDITYVTMTVDSALGLS